MNLQTRIRCATWALGGLLLSMPAQATSEVWQDPQSGIPFVAVPKGCSAMGRDADLHPPFDSYWENIGYQRPVNADEKPEHQVCVDAFWLGQTEVTQQQWVGVMGGEIPADRRWAGKARGGVSFAEAQEFLRRLNERSGGKPRYRLPTEAEWEYACRAGGKEPELAEEALPKVAHYGVDYIERAKPRDVGRLQANAFGLHDMLGNVWEWTADAYLADAYSRHVLYNPRVEPSTQSAPRVIRGGSLRSEAVIVRCSKRGRMAPDEALPLTGLRVVMEGKE